MDYHRWRSSHFEMDVIGSSHSNLLNAYLLKGVATGNAAVADGNAAGASAYAAARMIGAHLDSGERGRGNLTIGKSIGNER